MDQQYDPVNVFTSMHHQVTGELLRLMDGLYSNIEDALFEMASRTRSEGRKRRCFDLMRELRYHRSQAIQQFARGMRGSLAFWFTDAPEPEEGSAKDREMASQMAEKCAAHFSTLLQSVAERTAHAMGREVDTALLPISPYRIASNFIRSMQTLEFDHEAIQVIQTLFGRFVLDRMGPVYGACNQRLEEAGFCTIRELDQVAGARA